MRAAVNIDRAGPNGVAVQKITELKSTAANTRRDRLLAACLLISCKGRTT